MRASVDYVLTAGQEIELLQTRDSTGTAAIDLTGNELVNTIAGNAGSNKLDGGGGIDVLQGLGGDDSYYVDTFLDKVREIAGGGTDRVLASASYTLASGQEIEQLTTTNTAGTAAINLVGNEFANKISGNAGSNVIDGGLGNDALAGLGGHDTFEFSMAPGSTNIDTIADFGATNDDIIQLSHATYMAAGPDGALEASAFHVGASATDTSQRIIYNSANGGLYYDTDGLGGAAQVQFAKLSTGLAMTNADFVIA